VIAATLIARSQRITRVGDATADVVDLVGQMIGSVLISCCPDGRRHLLWRDCAQPGNRDPVGGLLRASQKPAHVLGLAIGCCHARDRRAGRDSTVRGCDQFRDRARSVIPSFGHFTSGDVGRSGIPSMPCYGRIRP
jgi:hypothetical protein